MSGTEEHSLKAGHPPAVKAGGMRITQHKSQKEDREAKIDDSKPSSSPPKTMIISGAVCKGSSEYTPEAVQHFHEKPLPTHDSRAAHNSRPMVIQQPRK